MNDFVYVSAVLLWGFNIYALYLVGRFCYRAKKIKDELAEINKDFDELKTLLADIQNEVSILGELIERGNKDQQEIKTRLHWMRERDLKIIAQKKKK